MADTLDQAFVRYSVDKLRQYKDRILACLDKLSYEQVWTRGSENENAVGNLVLHLCGNVRQWIGTGVAGKPDVRVRDREFSARGNIQPEELKERLITAVEDAVAVIEELTPDRLMQRTRVQNYDLTVLEAVYHVVEHFAGHTGQIIFATKAFTGSDLGFYAHLSKPKHEEKTP
jgi:uncharacterized damage-inducible protein DinB